MGFLSRSAKGEDAELDGNEELYRELFAKIGRDFVYKDDLKLILSAMLAAINPLLVGAVELSSDIEATKRARLYKKLLDEGDTTKKFKDLINMDDD